MRRWGELTVWTENSFIAFNCYLLCTGRKTNIYVVFSLYIRIELISSIHVLASEVLVVERETKCTQRKVLSFFINYVKVVWYVSVCVRACIRFVYCDFFKNELQNTCSKMFWFLPVISINFGRDIYIVDIIKFLHRLFAVSCSSHRIVSRACGQIFHY